MPVTIDEDEGYLSVDMKRKDGTTTEPVRLDLFVATNSYLAIYREHTDLVERGNAWVAYLVEQGLPPLAHGPAFALAGQMQDMVEEYRKKKPGLVWEVRDSPDSTGSTAPS